MKAVSQTRLGYAGGIKMKIAMMTNNYKPFIGGVPISIERLSDSLRKIGHEVVVFAPAYPKREKESNVIRYRSLPWNMSGAVLPNCLDPLIEKTFKEGNFDVIHTHHPMLIGRTALYLSGKYGVPLVFTYHTRYESYLHYIGMPWLKSFLPFYVREYAKHCHMVIAPTLRIKDYLEEIAVKTPVTVLPTGIGESSFYPDREHAAMLRKDLLRGKKYLFCTVSRLAPEKNIDFLLHSLSIRKREEANDFQFLIIGEGPQETKLKQLAAALGLEEEVVFTGQVPNNQVKDYCHASDLFLFASTTETQGIVSLEAMAAGIPVLAVFAAGTSDMIINGRNGYMTVPSVVKFAEGITEILLKKETEKLSAGAYETALSYSEDEIARRAALCYSAAIWKMKEKTQRAVPLPYPCSNDYLL